MNTLVKMHKTMNISIKRIVTAFLLLFFTSFTCVMAQKDDSGGKGAGQQHFRRGCKRYEGLGDRKGRDALYSLVSAYDRHHRREA